MVSYRKLLDFEARMIGIEAGFKTLVSLTRKVDDHELRLVALEQIQAIDLAKSSVWASLRTFAYGVGSALAAVLTAIVAGGYLGALPKLWGG